MTKAEVRTQMEAAMREGTESSELWQRFYAPAKAAGFWGETAQVLASMTDEIGRGIHGGADAYRAILSDQHAVTMDMGDQHAHRDDSRDHAESECEG